MKERPTLFLTEMVKAILEGRKTNTRRVMKPQPEKFPGGILWKDMSLVDARFKSPYGIAGDVLWVRETFWNWGYWSPVKSSKKKHRFVDLTNDDHPIRYVASDEEFYKGDYLCGVGYHKRPSIYMPKKASRIRLVVKDVRIERIQDISDEDCVREGIHGIGNQWDTCLVDDTRYKSTPRKAFIYLWDSINEKRGFGWDKNLYVWVVEFEME
jgi:hypothetical protein